MTRWLYLSIALTAAAVAYSAWYGPRAIEALPDKVPVHWDIRMQPDKWATKDEVRASAPWYEFGLPGAMALLVALNLVLPWLSPQRFKVDEFRSTFDYGMLLAVGLMGYLHLIFLHGMLGGDGPSARWLFGGMFLFFALFGNVMGKVKSNFWMGVRTPWTLASAKVWERTHRLTAWLWVPVGLVGFVAAVALPEVVAVALMPVLLVVLLYPVLYSLLLYKRLEKAGQLESQQAVAAE